MSHVAVYKTKIVNPDRAVLRSAVEQVAAAHDGQTTTQIKGYFTKDDREVELGLTTPDFPRGLGVTVDDSGALEFVCDPYAFERQVDALKAEIVRVYQTVAVTRVLTELGYTLTADVNAAGTLIEGVRG